jgi:hypothetical protein
MYVHFGVISILSLGIISISCFLLMGSGEIINLEIITGYLQEWE